MSAQDLYGIIEDKNINAFYFFNGPKAKVFSSELSRVVPSYVLTTLNKHFYYLLIAEHCFVVSKLCALRWNYLARITEYETHVVHETGVTIIDLTMMFYDSNILYNINHSSFTYTFMKFLYEGNSKQLFMKREELDAWRPFIDLLIPPNNYWSHDFDETINVVISDDTSTMGNYGMTRTGPY